MNKNYVVYSPSMSTLNFLCFAITCLFLLGISSSLNASADLEEKIQDFILETKRIEIPGFPYAFNASIIEFQGSKLLSFRNPPNSKSNFESNIGVIWLDDDFNPVGLPQILNTQENFTIPSRAEDTRLVNVNDRLYMVYDDNRDVKISKGGFRIYITELVYDGKNFCLENTECIKTFPGESSARREKSWVPFDYKGQLLLAYSLDPHLIFKLKRGRGACDIMAVSKPSYEWNWGELRGGTPGLAIDETQYLAFFHSSKLMRSYQSNNECMSHYFIGAYTFMREPPFEITQISSEPIIAKGFYSGKSYKYYWNPLRVVFPCGYIYDENYIWIAYGRHDHEVWIVKLDKKGLMKSLKPVTQSVNQINIK
jgi:predicted GH43/DUF377 family glycosyl hydrolase